MSSAPVSDNHPDSDLESKNRRHYNDESSEGGAPSNEEDVESVVRPSVKWCRPVFLETLSNAYPRYHEGKGKKKTRVVSETAELLREIATKHKLHVPELLETKVRNWLNNEKAKRARAQGVLSVPRVKNTKHEDGGRKLTERDAVAKVFKEPIAQIMRDMRDAERKKAIKGKGRAMEKGPRKGEKRKGEGKNEDENEDEDEDGDKSESESESEGDSEGDSEGEGEGEGKGKGGSGTPARLLLGYRQKAITEFMAGMTEEQREQAQAFQTKVNSEGRTEPLTSSEIDTLAKKVRNFALATKRVYGAHIVVMAAFRTEDEDIGATQYEVPLPFGQPFVLDPSFQRAYSKFKTFGQSSLAVDENLWLENNKDKIHRAVDADETGLKWYFPTNKAGWPAVPDQWPEGMSLVDMKDVVRCFLTIRYRLVSGNPNARVPFTEIVADRNAYIHPRFLPAKIHFCDPSKMKEIDINRMVSHWRSRVERNRMAFDFQTVRAKDLRYDSIGDGPQEANGSEFIAPFAEDPEADGSDKESDDNSLAVPAQKKQQPAAAGRRVAESSKRSAPPAEKQKASSLEVERTPQESMSHTSRPAEKQKTQADPGPIQKKRKAAKQPGKDGTARAKEQHTASIEPEDAIFKAPHPDSPASVAEENRLDWLRRLSTEVDWQVLVDYVKNTPSDAPHGADSGDYRYNGPSVPWGWGWPHHCLSPKFHTKDHLEYQAAVTYAQGQKLTLPGTRREKMDILLKVGLPLRDIARAAFAEPNSNDPLEFSHFTHEHFDHWRGIIAKHKENVEQSLAAWRANPFSRTLQSSATIPEPAVAGSSQLPTDKPAHRSAAEGSRQDTTPAAEAGKSPAAAAEGLERRSVEKDRDPQENSSTAHIDPALLQLDQSKHLTPQPVLADSPASIPKENRLNWLRGFSTDSAWQILVSYVEDTPLHAPHPADRVRKRYIGPVAPWDWRWPNGRLSDAFHTQDSEVYQAAVTYARGHSLTEPTVQERKMELLLKIGLPFQDVSRAAFAEPGNNDPLEFSDLTKAHFDTWRNIIVQYSEDVAQALADQTASRGRSVENGSTTPSAEQPSLKPQDGGSSAAPAGQTAQDLENAEPEAGTSAALPQKRGRLQEDDQRDGGQAKKKKNSGRAGKMRTRSSGTKGGIQLRSRRT
ncbi:hypothetical protein BC835DRAFT_1309723 [Cytidiella melzeri]|nr:hypothetical protein BC835DRAFT_1309723 [Cytidiella melzeri]